MSIESWKEEFYSEDADDVLEQDAIEHSLRKWIGLRPENLEKHDLRHDHSFLFHKNKNLSGLLFTINSHTCALCVHYYDDEAEEQSCAKCPLFKIRQLPCDEAYRVSPYHKFIGNGNPEPMIELLQTALENSKKSQ